MSGRQKIRLVNAGTPRLYRDYVATFLHTVNSSKSDASQLLLTLSVYSNTIDLYGVINAHGLTYQGFAIANYCLLTNFQPFLPFKTQEIRVYEETRAVSVVKESEAVQEDWPTIQDPKRRMEEAKLSLLRNISEAGLFQQEVIYKVANALVIAGLKPFRDLPIEKSAIDPLFRKYVGISAYDYYLLLFGIWINSKGHPVFSIDIVLGKVRRKKQLVPVGKKVCTELAYSTSDFHHSRLNSRIEKISARFRGSAYFGLKPLISLGDSYFACVAHPFLRAHVTSKFTQKALALARTEEPNVGGRTTLSRFMGEARLEAFFRELCNEWAPLGGHHDEFTYAEGMKSSDRIVFEQVEGAPFVTLIQLKLKTLPTSVHFAESWREITDDFSKSFADCILKSLKFLYNLEEADRKKLISPKFRDLATKILSHENFCFVGIVPDLPPVFSISYARQALENCIKKKISQDKDRNFEKWCSSTFPDGYLWHIMDLTEFQFMLSTPKGSSLANEVSKYVTLSGIDSDPLQGDGTISPSFKNWLIDRYGTTASGGGKRISNFNPRLLRLFTETKDDLGYLLFKPFHLRWGRLAYLWIRERFRGVRAWIRK